MLIGFVKTRLMIQMKHSALILICFRILTPQPNCPNYTLPPISRLNNTNYDTLPPTSHSHSTNNIHMRVNDGDDVFCLNTQHLNTSFSTNDSDVRSTFRNSYNAESTLPALFRNMMNVHQICLWLCANPNILILAYNLYLLMQAPANSFNFVTPNFNSSTLPTSVPQILKQDD